MFNKKYLNAVCVAVAGLSFAMPLTVSSVAQAGPFDGVHDTTSGLDLEASGTVFNMGLYDGYVDLSKDLNLVGYGNLDDVELFNHKAVLAGHESPVDPDEVMDRVLTNEEQATFTQALYRLRMAYNRGSREFAPALSATAQVGFDCWIEAVEDDATQRASDCKRKFEDAIAAAEAVSNKEIVGITVSPPLRPIDMTPAPAPAPAPEPIPQAVLDQYLVVPFEFDKTVMIPEGRQALEDALVALNQYQTLRVNLIAHADRAGSIEYNDKLSQRRADKVLNELLSRGISADRIDIVKAVGETQSLVPTPDGVPEQGNRVVELDLKQ